MSAFNFAPFPILFTQNLKLRKFQPDDIRPIFEMRSSKNNQTYLDRSLSQTEEEAQSFFEKIIAGIDNNEWIMWGLALKTTNAFVGSVCLWNLNGEKMIGELGYETHPDFQGKGFIQEAVKAIIEYGFSKMNLKKITAIPHEHHAASIHILEKNNFSKGKNLEGAYSHLVIFELEKERFENAQSD